MQITRNIKLVSNEQLQALFDDFERISKVREDGTLSFNSFLATIEWKELLPDAFNIKPALRRSTAIRLFYKALSQARRDGALTADAVIARAKDAYRQDHAIRLKKFTLWTKIRASGMDPTKNLRFKWGNVSMRTVAKLPKWLLIKPFVSGVNLVDPNQPKNGGYIILSCQERLEDDAVDLMIDALQLLMALMNIYETRGAWTITTDDNNWTAGGLRMGPFQFVFQGKRYLGRPWYDPNYDEKAWKERLTKFERYLKIAPFTKKALLTLENHPLKQVLVTAAQLAQDAFEARDGNHRLLRFWAALEKIYVEESARERSNEKVINRASFADEDYQVTKWKLSHVARLRNEHVHSRGQQGSFMQQGQMLRDLLSRHILHWIFHGHDFDKHEALLAYVDLPREDNALKALQKNIDRRIKLNEQRQKS
jgi:hypothetical protein